MVFDHLMSDSQAAAVAGFTMEEMAKVFDHLMQASQAAAGVGFTMEQVANICTVGFLIGSDPLLGEMIKNITNISKLGLDIVEK